MFRKLNNYFFLHFLTFVFLLVNSFKCPGDVDLPETNMDAEELIVYNGYQVETHRVLTKDGYVLVIHRIPHGKIFLSHEIKKDVILLQHGLASASSHWILNLPNQSLPFILADHGYDVWMSNSRGNSYSNEHTTLRNYSNYWDFSWENMAEYDLPVIIDYILNFTMNEDLVYIGHSQGTLIGFALFSSDVKLAKKIKLFIALAPVSTVGDIKSHFKYLVPFTWSLQSTIEMFGHFSLSDLQQYLKYIRYSSNAEEGAQTICRKVSIYLSALDTTTVINKTRLPVYLGHIPDDTSMKNFAHYGQMVSSGRMQKYDYGFIKNYLIYGQFSPPEYNLEHFNVKTVVFWSPIDELASGKDTETLLNKLKNVTKVYKIDSFRHFDFLLSLKATEDVYNVIVSLLKNETSA